MTEIFIFRRDVTKDEWSALPRAFKRGDKIARFHGHTYGLDRDDAMYGGRETIPCYLLETGDSIFFTVPVEFLVDESGIEPSSDYLTPEHWLKIRELAILYKGTVG